MKHGNSYSHSRLLSPEMTSSNSDVTSLDIEAIRPTTDSPPQTNPNNNPSNKRKFLPHHFIVPFIAPSSNGTSKWRDAPGTVPCLYVFVWVALILAFANSLRTLHWGWNLAQAVLAVPMCLTLYLVASRDPGVIPPRPDAPLDDVIRRLKEGECILPQLERYEMDRNGKWIKFPREDNPDEYSIGTEMRMEGGASTASPFSPYVSPSDANDPNIVILGTPPLFSRRGHAIKGIFYKYCEECRIWRDQRSSHCDRCGYCIEKWDHHCGVLGICIGRKNRRWFASFLLLAALSCVVLFAGSIVHLNRLGCPKRSAPCWDRPDTYFMIATLIPVGYNALVLLGFGGYHAFISFMDVTQRDLMGFSGEDYAPWSDKGWPCGFHRRGVRAGGRLGAAVWDAWCGPGACVPFWKAA